MSAVTAGDERHPRTSRGLGRRYAGRLVTLLLIALAGWLLVLSVTVASRARPVTAVQSPAVDGSVARVLVLEGMGFT